MEIFADVIKTLFSHPIWNFLTFISCFSIFVLSILFTMMGCLRLRGLKPTSEENKLTEYPKVSVVMCCKGIHDQSKSNFIRNMKMQYPGPAEFIFVVESENDPAAACAREAIAETPFNPNLDRDATVVVAGLSYHNAQKIHNMLIGVTACSEDSEFVLFADDDVFFYPGLLEELVSPLVLESNKVLLSTGYEFIAPQPGASIWNYCMMTYRLHNLFSFITDRPILCWGGCWMAPLWIFRKNFAHLVDCYLDGGYSDDTIVSCLAQQKGYVCAHPYKAIFPSVPSKNLPFIKYWDFLTRQFFVTDTYSTNYNKRVVHSLAYLIITSIWLLVTWISISPIIGVLSILAYFTSTAFVWNYVSTFSTISFFMWFALTKSIKFATNAMNDVSNSTRTPDQQTNVKLSSLKIFIGLNTHCFFMPIAVIYILISKSIIWSGVKYYKENGKIWKVERKDENGNVVTELFASSISKVLTQTKIKQLLNGFQNNQFL